MEDIIVKEKVLKMIREINPYEDVDENSKLIEDAIIDSLTLIILIKELENEFSIRIPEDKLRPELFESVQQIVGLLNELLIDKNERTLEYVQDGI